LVYYVAKQIGRVSG